jgi:hypothetical protein
MDTFFDRRQIFIGATLLGIFGWSVECRHRPRADSLNVSSTPPHLCSTIPTGQVPTCACPS